MGRMLGNYSKSGFTPRITSGRWYDTNPGDARGSTVLATGVLFLRPFWPGESGTIDGLAFELVTASTGGTSDNLLIGLYDDNGTGLPTGAPLFSTSGQNLQASPAVKTISVSWTSIVPKLYWIGVLRLSVGSPSGGTQRTNTNSAQELGVMFTSDSAGAPTIGSAVFGTYAQTGVSGSLPTIGSIAQSTSNTAVVLYKFS